MNDGLGVWVLRVGLLVPVKGDNATAHKDILLNYTPPTFWQQFGEDPCAQSQLHKDMV